MRNDNTCTIAGCGTHVPSEDLQITTMLDRRISYQSIRLLARWWYFGISESNGEVGCKCFETRPEGKNEPCEISCEIQAVGKERGASTDNRNRNPVDSPDFQTQFVVVPRKMTTNISNQVQNPAARRKALSSRCCIHVTLRSTKRGIQQNVSVARMTAIKSGPWIFVDR